MAKVEVSVVLPALNEATNLRALVPRLLAEPGVNEVVVVDDASGDDSILVCRELARAFPSRFHFIGNSVRLGLACSTLQGLLAAKNRYAIVRDSDLNHDVGAIAGLIAAAEEGTSLAIASRYLRGRKRVGRTNDLFSIFLSGCLSRIFGRISDWSYGYYLLDRRLLSDLPVDWIFRGRGEYTLRLYRTLLRRPAFSLHEIPTRVKERGSGQSTTRLLRHGLAYLSAVCERSGPAQARISDLDGKVEDWLKAGSGRAGSGHGFLGARARMALAKAIAPFSSLPVLDLGCGNGAFTRAWLPEQVAVDGVDRSPRALAMAKERSYRRVFSSRLPELPAELRGQRYGGIVCFEVLQYLEGEELARLFSACSPLAEANARLVCLVPNRFSYLHRLRRAIFPRHVDYSTGHDLALLCAAAQSAGWRMERARGVLHGRQKVKSLAVHDPSPWQSLALLEFVPFQLTIQD